MNVRRSTFSLIEKNSSKGIKYLGALISSNGCNNNESASRQAQVKMNFQIMKLILTNKYISINPRRSLKYFFAPILMSGCKAKTTSKPLQKKEEATEIWFLWRMQESYELQSFA